MQSNEIRTFFKRAFVSPTYADQLRIEQVAQIAELNENFQRFFSYVTPKLQQQVKEQEHRSPSQERATLTTRT